MIPHSIRWRLSFSFAAIALLAAVALGAVLLTILRSYYSQRELDYLRGNARSISADLTLIGGDAPPEVVQSQVENFSFLSQTRVRVLDANGLALYDSGVPQTVKVGFGVAKRAMLVSGSAEKPPSDFVRFISIGDIVTETVVITDVRSGLPAMIPEPGARVMIAFKSMPVVGTPYGFGLDTEAALSSRRSNQVVRQSFSDSAGKSQSYVELSEGPAYGRDILDSVARGWAMASAVAVVLAAVVGWIISRRISAPLLALTGVTTRMAEGDLSVRASVAGRDEFGRLGRSFNEMADRVEATVTALRRFVSDAAHELHTPLTALRTNLELAAGEKDEATRLAFVERAQAQIVRLETLTGELLDLSRIEAGADQNGHASLDLVTLTQTTSEPYASQAEQAGVAFSLDLPMQAVTVMGHEAQLRCALGNLLDNAIKFTPEGGAVNVYLRQEGQWAQLVVEDTGIGIPAEDLPQLFSRFHRGRNATTYPGSGLGLAIVKAIAESHAGQVTAENVSPGTRFSLRLPVS